MQIGPLPAVPGKLSTTSENNILCAHVSGVLVSEGSNVPIAGATVAMQSPGAPQTLLVTDQRGYFSLECLTGDSVTVRANSCVVKLKLSPSKDVRLVVRPGYGGKDSAQVCPWHVFVVHEGVSRY
jgi:hypothetical protein